MASSSSSPSRNAAVSPPQSPNLSSALSLSCYIDDSEDKKKQSQPVDDDSSLVGWWCGISKDGKDPYGHIIRVSAEHGKYLARSYSPWQLAASKEGTTLFEIYVTTSDVGEKKDAAIYLKHKAAAQDGKVMDSVENVISMPMFQLTPEGETSKGLLAEIFFRNLISANRKNATNPLLMMACSEFGIDPNLVTGAATDSDSGNLNGKNQTVIWIEFAIGSFKETDARKSENEVHRVPAVLERKGCFSFCVSVEEDKDQQFDGYVLEGYRTVDHCTFDVAESLGKGKLKKHEDDGKFWPHLSSQARNEQPVLSGLTTFNKINLTVSSDPLTGLYIASNGYLVTEVVQFTRKFGQWQENGEMVGSSMTESCDYVEAVRLTGDPDVPAGQVVFRAKVGEQYKLTPGPVMQKKFGAVARYRGKGRLTGFQKSRWVDVEVFILGEKYRKDGFALGFLYSASKYYVLKLFKQLSLPGSQNSH